MKIKNLKFNPKKIASLCLAAGISFFSSLPNAYCELDYEVLSNKTTNTESVEDKKDFVSGLKKAKTFSQKNAKWKDWLYVNGNTTRTLNEAGCGPFSITNALSLAFGLKTDNDFASLLKDILQIGANYKTINDHLTKKYSNRKSTSFNKLINQSDTVMLNGGNNAKNILSKVRKTTALGKKDTYIFGITSFNLNNFDNLIKIIKELYDKNLDINMVFYNMTAGNINLERPFGSISNNGHYVSLLVNVQEFVENNTLYFIDSLPRNIKNEHNHKINYNFVEKPNKGKLRSFNQTFDVERINEQILKLTVKNGKLNKKSLDLLGLDGGCGVIICPNNLQVKSDRYEINSNSYYDYNDEKVYVKSLFK